MDRFYLAENPLVQRGLAIIHMIEPVAIITLSLEDKQGKEFEKEYTYTNTDGIDEHWSLGIHHYFTTDMNAENHAPKAFKILDKAWHWYKSYLEWEDENIDENESYADYQRRLRTRRVSRAHRLNFKL